jgi:transcriptional regulator with XRE-family HTH domain
MTERPTWGTMLSQVRKSKGLSQSQLARKIGVPRTYISKIEISSAVPTVRSLLRFAAALKVQVEYLIPPEFSQSSLDFACEIYELAKDLNADQRHLILYFICSLSKGQMPFLEWETIPATDLKEPNYAAKTREVAQGRQ